MKKQRKKTRTVKKQCSRKRPRLKKNRDRSMITGLTTKGGLKMEVCQMLEYSVFFGESLPEAFNFSAVLSKYSREFLINFAAMLKNKCINRGLEVFDEIIDSRHIENRRIIKERLVELRRMSGGQRFVFSSYLTALEILRIAYSLKPLSPGSVENIEKDELDLLKVILAINERKAHIDNGEELSLAKIIFVMSNANSLALGEEDWALSARFVFQSQMAVRFFNLLSTNQDYAELYAEFLSYYGIKDWREYVRTISALSLILGSEDKVMVLNKNLSFDVDKIIHEGVLRKISIQYGEIIPYATDNPEDRNANDDYRVFRSRPVLIRANGEWTLFSKGFLVDKLFNGLLFDLNEIKRLKKIRVDVNKLFTKVFSEGKVFNGTLERCADPTIFKAITEDLCNENYKAKKGELGPPDYMLEAHSKLIVFECKDVRIAGNVLESNDYERIVEEYANKLYKKTFNIINGQRVYFEGDEFERVGVTQLTDHLRRIRMGDFPWVKCDASVAVYPVLVLSDYKYIQRGFPEIANAWYNESIGELGIEHKNNKQLIVMSFVTLDKYAGLFKQKGFDFFFEEYYKVYDGIVTFDEFLSRYKVDTSGAAEEYIRWVFGDGIVGKRVE